jgi:hypothetical protein
MGLVEFADEIDTHQIWQDLYPVLVEYNLLNEDQISLTSISGDNDWKCSIGKMKDLQYPERYYSTLNKAFENTSIDLLVQKYPQFYRWRLLRVAPKQTYSVHQDSLGEKNNIRIHIPVKTNERAFLAFYLQVPLNTKETGVKHYHLEEGKSYFVNTSGFHTAVNYGDDHRYHIVGVRYENSTDRAH